MAKVYVTCPNGSGYIHKLVHRVLCGLLSDRRHEVRVDCPTHSPYQHNLSMCMNDFLDGGEDFWLSIDDDNPPTRNPLDLVEWNLDLVGFPTPVWHSAVMGDRPFYLNALDRVGDGFKPHEPCQGLQEVDAIGSGCFLVSRRVMESVRFDQPFARMWSPDGTQEMGGDFSFCCKVKEKGFRVFAHYDYLCEHIQRLPLLEAIQAFAAMEPARSSGPS